MHRAIPRRDPPTCEPVPTAEAPEGGCWRSADAAGPNGHLPGGHIILLPPLRDPV